MRLQVLLVSLRSDCSVPHGSETEVCKLARQAHLLIGLVAGPCDVD